MKPMLLLAVLLGLAAAACAEETQGFVQPFKSVSVSSPVLQEVVESVLVEEGDTVQKDQVLVQLRAEKEALDVEQAKKLVEARSFTASGAQKLLSQYKIGSQEQVLQKQTELELAEIALRLAEVRLKEKTVRAPMAGIVVKKYKENGESVDRVEKLIDLVNIDQVYVMFYLDPKLMPAMKLETSVQVKFTTIGNFTGKISFINPRIDAASGLFQVKVLLDNPEHTIKAGMRGIAEFAKLGT
jgi:RND family efflux transporter MFP subunit